MKRASGVLLHITSLPSRGGIGHLGGDARAFADFLKAGGQTYWQILPLNPTDTAHGNTPYSSISAFAGNPLLISPDTDLKNKNSRDLVQFHESNSFWLDDFAAFQAIRDHFGGKPWNEWPKEIRDREAEPLKQLTAKLKDKVDRSIFLQYVFFRQWASLKEYCNDKGLRIIGDIPIYVNHDSVDVWTNPEMFKLGKNKLPVTVAGVPPDYFSATGQLWGNPVYDWDYLKKTGFDWWIKRMEHNFSLYDLVRMDHFRGFVAAWEVARGEATAERGMWVKAPGEELFGALVKRFPRFPIIAEDLGVITDDVRYLMRHFGFPGMKVLIFAFGGDAVVNQNAPHNHIRNCVVYTGTHDSNTARGWFEEEASEDEKRNLFDCLEKKISSEEVSWEFVKLAMSSVADTAIIPMQDILGLGSDARMNTPGTTAGNWEWRLSPDQISSGLSAKLLEVTRNSGRA